MGETYTEVVRDLRERLNNLDQREIILQKAVARLEAKVDMMIKLHQEQTVSRRWLISQVVAAFFAALAFAISLWELLTK